MAFLPAYPSDLAPLWPHLSQPHQCFNDALTFGDRFPGFSLRTPLPAGGSACSSYSVKATPV
jgi:hypothetical protein